MHRLSSLRGARWWGLPPSSPSRVKVPLGEPIPIVTGVPVLTDNRNNTASARSFFLDDDSLYRKEGKHETHESNSSRGFKGKSPTPIRRSASLSTDRSHCASPKPSTRTLVDTLLVHIGKSDHEGWMRKKGGHFSTWKIRYLVLKGSYLYWLANDNPQVCVAWLAVVVFHRLTHCRPMLRDMSTLSAVELFQTKTSTPGHMDSNYCVGRKTSTFSALMIKPLSVNG